MNKYKLILISLLLVVAFTECYSNEYQDIAINSLDSTFTKIMQFIINKIGLIK